MTTRIEAGRARRALDGVLLFDKPLALSSNTALQKVRRLYRAEKAGHTGTLDPLASGLLPVCFGEATKFTTMLLDADKSYRATLKLGQRTTSGDAEGEVIEVRPVAVDWAKVQNVLERFLGEGQQLPPMHSALKHAGKPLYEYIRQGETVARTPRRIVIHALQAERLAGDELTFSVRCSKGTYVRTLGEDIGAALGCGGHLIALCRTAIGPFSLETAIGLPQMESMDEAARDARLLPLDALVQELPALIVDEVQALRLARGQRLGMSDDQPDGLRRLYAAGQFIGLGRLEAGRLVPDRLLSRVAKAAATPLSAA